VGNARPGKDRSAHGNCTRVNYIAAQRLTMCYCARVKLDCSTTFYRCIGLPIAIAGYISACGVFPVNESMKF